MARKPSPAPPPAPDAPELAALDSEIEYERQYQFSPPAITFTSNGTSCAFSFMFKRRDRLPLTADELPKLLIHLGNTLLKDIAAVKGDT